MTPADFFTLSEQGATQVVALELLDALDGTEFDQMNEALAAVVREHPQSSWVLDLTHVEYTGSAVLGVIVNFRQAVKQTRGQLILCGMSQRLMEIFKTCSLDRLFKTVSTRSAAVKALS